MGSDADSHSFFLFKQCVTFMTEDYYQTIRKQFSGPFFFIMVAVKMHCFGYALGDHWWLHSGFIDNELNYIEGLHIN